VVEGTTENGNQVERIETGKTGKWFAVVFILFGVLFAYKLVSQNNSVIVMGIYAVLIAVCLVCAVAALTGKIPTHITFFKIG